VPFANAPLDHLQRAIFSVDTPMAALKSETRQHLSDEDLTALHLVSMAWRTDLPANPAVAIDLLEVAREIEDLIIGATEIDEQTRDYILQLTRHLQDAIASVAVRGTADVRRLADQLVGAMVRYLSDELPDNRQKTASVIERLVGHVKVFLGLVPPTAKAIDAVQNLFPPALPPGS
jgi:hypothetical protein